MVLLTIGIAIYGLTVDGAMAGVKYYLTPDLSKISISAVCAALSQLFYSLSIALGIPSALGYGLWGSVKILGMQFLDFFDFISNSVIMPIAAICTCILVGYFIKPKAIQDEVNISGKFKRYGMYQIMMKYVGPILLVVIFVSAILNAFGVISL